MFKVFANRNFIEGVLINQTPKIWYNIFMSGNVAEVCVPEDMNDECIDSMGANDIFSNLQLLGTIIKTCADYINEIPHNSRLVLDNPSAVFLLKISPKEAETIQKNYGVICQSVDAIDDEILTKAYEFNLYDGKKGVDWAVFFNKRIHTIPSNALIICDRYIFCVDHNKPEEDNVLKAIELGLSNIRGILNSILPRRYNDVYNVLIAFDSSKLIQSEEQEMILFKYIAEKLRDYAKENKKSRFYKIHFDLISIDKTCTNYKKLHNRRIIGNYFLVRADYKLRAFNDNESTVTQTIFYDALFSKVFPMTPSGPDSPIKSQLQTIECIQEIILNGKCRKYTSFEDKQDITVTKDCKTCTNRLIINNS